MPRYSRPSDARDLADAAPCGLARFTRPEDLGWRRSVDGGLARALLDRGGSLWNLYGPTETTIWSTACRIEPGFERISIGSPIGNTQVYLLDEYFQPVPVGVPGELYIGGAGVTRGYLNRPDLTAAKFIPNPFGTQEGDRLYRTGDLARWLPNGQIEFLGRMDHQVKVRGFRIELGEIEAALVAQESVREAVVIVRPDHLGQSRLVAYVVPQVGSAVSVESLRSLLSQRLPDYMVPSAFVPMDAIPLTPNQKVDRNALPLPDNLRPGLEQQYEAPRSPIEAAVAEIWSELLGVDRVGVQDRFFDLGGHSLMATQVLSRVRQQFEVELPLRQLFEQPTVANLARMIERATGQQEALLPITPIDRSEDLPLSFAQERLWFLDQLKANSAFYNVPAAVRLLGPLDVARIESCLNEIVRRHDALRTHFEVVEGRAAQRIADSAPLNVPVIDLSQLPEEQREVETRRLATEEAQRPFSLATGPLVRACLLRLGPTEHVFLLTMHHIVSDGWSLGVFAQELASLYGAPGEVDSSSLKKLPVQYVDYAVWQREQMSGDRLDATREFWKRELEGIPQALDLPTDRSRPAEQTFAGQHLPIELSGELTEALKQLSQSHNVTLFMTLLAGFQTLLARYSGQDQVCVGTPIAGRDRVGNRRLDRCLRQHACVARRSVR